MEHIDAIERRLWGAADTLRANSNHASNEYFMPVMGLVFLRHAYSRYLAVKDQIIADLPTRGGKPRELNKADFSEKSAIYLRPEAHFDYLVSLPEGTDVAKAIISAMNGIEEDYQALDGQLPKNEYQEIERKVLADLLKTLNPEELKHIKGDVFGRIYEYFLTQFADQKAHDGGEFFTPVSLVQTIVNIIEPKRGKVLDPACGSGGMFVQSAHLVESQNRNPNEVLTFYGAEKNPTTIRLAKMNLAVHGLEGNIQKAITYYDDPHDLLGKADFVMANPPFNVDEVDESKVVNDPRLPFGIPGVNKKKKISNGNYLWISYFYSYLKPTGRAGFVMSSQASSAGRDEAVVRRKLVETGHVDAMIAIRSNFFYTRTVPCELWFFDKAKPEKRLGDVLMIDARNIYRKVTRKIYDFSPEQQQNLASIVWLYREQNERFLKLVRQYLGQCLLECRGALEITDGEGDGQYPPLQRFSLALKDIKSRIGSFVTHADFDRNGEAPDWPLMQEGGISEDMTETLKDSLEQETAAFASSGEDIAALQGTAQRLEELTHFCRDLIQEIEGEYKRVIGLIARCEKEWDAGTSDFWNGRDMNKAQKTLDEARKEAVEPLKQVRYFYRQAHWLLERFPEGRYRDVEGLVKRVSLAEIAQNDWSLTPGRYVGVAPEEHDEEFDFEQTMRDLHNELQDLNAEAVELAAKIAGNFEGLGV